MRREGNWISDDPQMTQPSLTRNSVIAASLSDATKKRSLSAAHESHAAARGEPVWCKHQTRQLD